MATTCRHTSASHRTDTPSLRRSTWLAPSTLAPHHAVTGLLLPAAPPTRFNLQTIWNYTTSLGYNLASYGHTAIAWPAMTGVGWAGLAVVHGYGDYTCWACVPSTKLPQYVAEPKPYTLYPADPGLCMILGKECGVGIL